jgi:NADPH:quinone reductase-like Zn-dependent oxidoreductase
MGAFRSSGDVLGHEAIGIVLEVGRDITQIRRGDLVVVPFQISCGHCWMCERQLYTQCETTQVRGEGSGAALFGYSKLYGQVPGAQAEYLRVPEAQFTHILVQDGPPDDRFVYCPTYCPQRGKGWITPAYPTMAHCSSWASGRSATWPAGSPSSGGSTRSSRWTWWMRGWSERSPTASR